MNAHIEAWKHVKKHLFGTVCEVSRTKPWGFYMDKPDITNYTTDEFIGKNDKFDTIILHILSGEGVSTSIIKEVLQSAMDRCVKIIVLEHNPNSKDFIGLRDINYLKTILRPNLIHEEDWGRNMLYTTTTMHPLHLPQLNDEYHKKHINKTFVKPRYEGIDKDHLIYTHTSECPILFELPKYETILWTIGGGLAYESMKCSNNNILFDSCLRQVLYCAKIYGVTKWKIDRLYKFGHIAPEWPLWDGLFHHKINSAFIGKGWRITRFNGIKPNSIIHKSVQDIKCQNSTIYISTIHKNYWKHLIKNNNIIDVWTKRNKPKLVMCLCRKLFI